MLPKRKTADAIRLCQRDKVRLSSIRKIASAVFILLLVEISGSLPALKNAAE